MSERPTSASDLELKDLVIALRDLVECHALGLQLGLPESTLKLIDKHPAEDHLRMMLSEWLQYDPEASWEKLATTLNKLGKNAIAANVRREFLSSVSTADTQLTMNEKSVSSQLSLAAPTRKVLEEEGKIYYVEKQVGPSDNTQVEQDTTKRKTSVKLVSSVLSY